MVRNGQEWDLGEPELNDRGQPVIHNIASKLGCIRPNTDIDLPVHSIFPEDEAGMAELAHQLEEHQKEHGGQKEVKGETDSSSCNRTDRASSSELDHSDYEHDYRKLAFSSSNNPVNMSPQSFTTYNDFDVSSVQSEVVDPTAAMFPSQSPTMATYSQWQMQRTPTSMDLTAQFLQQTNGMTSIGMLNQELLESDFSTIKPHMLSCPNPEVMMGMGDPMIYSGFDGEPMRM
jgi:hypothetical protein